MARQYAVRMSNGHVSLCGSRQQAEGLIDALHRHRSQVGPRLVYRGNGDQEWQEDADDG